MSDNCGGHIHIGANYLTMEESWNNLGDIWGNAEKILYIISNKSGEIPRYKVNQTAKPFSKVLEKKLNDERGQVENKKCLKKLMINAQNGRYYGINFKKSDTIEFRLSNGTLDANTWIENINLFGGIIKVAQDLAIVQMKPENERTQEEQNLLRNFDKIKQEEVSEQNKFEALLTLVIPEEDRDIYRERYKENSKLLEQNSELEERIISGLAKRKIDMSEIGRKVFLGEDGITGEEYRNGVRIIEEALREETIEYA